MGKESGIRRLFSKSGLAAIRFFGLPVNREVFIYFLFLIRAKQKSETKMTASVLKKRSFELFMFLDQGKTVLQII